MAIIDLMRSGDLSPHVVWLLGSLLIVMPLALLTAKLKNRLSISVGILCVIPGINIYALFFLMLMRKVPADDSQAA